MAKMAIFASDKEVLSSVKELAEFLEYANQVRRRDKAVVW